MRRLLTTCPSCGGDLIVTELSCTSCDTVIRGRYTGCTFCELPEEDLRFLEIFVTCRGNVKEMERETGLSYWTIRGRLDDLIETLKLDRDPPAPSDSPVPGRFATRREVLEAVERGELSIVEAEQMLANWPA
jgi:hypothetical protein